MPMKEVSFRPTGFVWAAVMLMAAILAGCGTNKSRDDSYGVGSGDYRRDGPHANPPANLQAVPDATPRIEPLASGPNRPYVIAGKRYVPDTTGRPYRVKGRASWYGRQFHGRPTSSGEPYDMYAMTAAHPTLPIPSYARVTRVDNGRSVIVRINDRGPFIDSRVIDLSYVAAYKLDTLSKGTGEVIVEWISPDDIRNGTALAKASPQPAARSAAQAIPAPVQPSIGTAMSADSPAAYIASKSAATSSLPGAPASPAAPAAILSGISAAATPGVSPRPASLAIPVPAAPAPTAPSASPAPQVASNAGGSAFLQLGVFGEARNAHHLANRVRDSLAGLADIEVIETADRMYRVRLGPFSDRNTAVAHADAVYGHTGIRPHVMATTQ
jgi:rare lipoprotein A